MRKIKVSTSTQAPLLLEEKGPGDEVLRLVDGVRVLPRGSCQLIFIILAIQFFSVISLAGPVSNALLPLGPPVWTPIPNLQYNMNVIGKIQLSPDVFSLNENDILGAFVDTECRGIATPFPTLGGALFLTIGSNLPSGETVSFKIYLSLTDEIVDANQTIPFQNAGEVGTMANPFIFTYSVPCTLSVTPSDQIVTNQAGLTTFTVSSSCNWTAGSNQAWCDVTPTGSGNGTITATYSANSVISQRVASITVTASEIPSVTVTVTQEAGSGPPDWTPVPNLQYNMNVIGMIQLGGMYSTNGNDIIGAFVGTECRGVASPFPALGGALFLTIGSDVQSGETVTFKIYLASANDILDAYETISFQNAGEVGTMVSPFIFTTPIQNNIAVQGITVAGGQTRCFNALQTISVAGEGTNFVVQNGGTVTMIAGQKINFLPGSTVQSGGHLTAYITTTNSFCNTMMAPMVNVLGKDENSLPGSQGSSFFNIYPNPTSGKFTLELTGTSSKFNTLIRIYSMLGEEILKEEISGTQKKEFSLEGKPNRIFIITVIQDGKIGASKIIKQ